MRLRWRGSRCCPTTMPAAKSAGRACSTWVRAFRPPAEAARATMSKLVTRAAYAAVEHFPSKAYKGVREARMDQSRSFVIPGQNRILSTLSRDLQIRLLPRMEKMSLSIRQILYEPDEPITHAWFPLSGVVSLLIGLKGGEKVEVATVGNEGVAGIPLLLGADRGPLKAVCQVAGQALRMRADNFKRSLDEHPDFADIGMLVER